MEINFMAVRVANSRLLSLLEVISITKQLNEHKTDDFAVYSKDLKNYNIL